MKQYFCLGTYSEPILFGTGEVFEGTGKGLSICSFENGNIEIVNSLMTRNPSFLCINETAKKIYAVNELKEYLGLFGGGVSQYSYETGEIIEEATFNVRGTDPCHVEIAPDRSFISVANFASGSVTIFMLDESGNILPDDTFFQHEGSSVHPIRQKGPHAHATVFAKDESVFYVPDLGIDKVIAYSFCGGKIEQCPDKNLSVDAGGGPRSGVYSDDGKHFYLINEISSQVIHYLNDNNTLIYQSIVNTLPDDFDGNNICSDIHISSCGGYLYASNRGHDSLAVFKIDENGNLSLIERVDCGGKTPRNFSLDKSGKYLLCGNQDSDNIAVFNILNDGTLALLKINAINTPVCIKFFDTNPV